MSVDENIRVVQNVYDSFKRGDMEGVLASYAEGAEIRYPGESKIPWAGIIRGPRGVQHWVDTHLKTFDLEIFELRGIFGEGDEVATFGFERSTCRKTSVTYQSNWVHRFKVKNGKIVFLQLYLDTASMAETLQPSFLDAAGDSEKGGDLGG